MSHDSEGEDELSSPSLTSLRVTPRLATKRSASEALGSSDTPYTNLRKLASTIRATSVTPSAQQRAPSIGATSDSKLSGSAAAVRRNGAQGIGRYPRPVPAKRSAPSTPHAIRALEQRRRAALTPSREQRRRSGRQQRDSPRDILRNLSRVLAAKAKPSQPQTPLAQEDRATQSDNDDDSEDDELSRPRLSLPIDADSSIEIPPEMSALDDDLTQRSIEVGRRAFNEPFRGPSWLSEGFVLTPDQKVQPAADESFRRPDSSSLDIVVDDSILADNRQGNDTEDLRRLVFREQEDSLQDESMQDGDRPRHTVFDDSTFRFDIPTDLPPAAELAAPERTLEEEESLSDGSDGPEAPETADLMDYTEQFSAPLEAGVVVEDEDEADAEAAAPNRAKSPLNQARRRQKVTRQSRYGLPVPSLPVGVVKGVASAFVRSSGKGRKLNKDAVAALMQATDWYFEQLGDDLGAYSKHARRKVIAEADVVALMRRQRLLSTTSTPFSLAQKFLPRELLQEMRMDPPKDDEKKRKGRQKQVVGEESTEAESEAEED